MKTFSGYLDLWDGRQIDTALSLLVCNFDYQDRANEIYKKVEDQKPLRGRNQDAIVAACLYIACRQENKPRTVKGKKQYSSYTTINLFYVREFLF